MESFVTVPIVLSGSEPAADLSNWTVLSRTNNNGTLIMLDLNDAVPDGPVFLQENLTVDSSLTNELSLKPAPKLSEDDEDLIEQVSVTVTVFKCRLCTFQSSSKSELRDHVAVDHVALTDLQVKPSTDVIEEPETETRLPSEEEKLVYLCAKCSKAFVSFSDCKSHMHSVHGVDQRKFRGEAPPLPEYSVRSRKRTEKRNEKKTKFPCPVNGCLTRLWSKEDVEKHKKCHVEGDPTHFSCPQCSEVFSSGWPNFLNHAWRAHSVDLGLYSCCMCDYKTAFYEKSEQHGKIHHNERPYKCPNCSKAFKQRTQLRNHEVTHLKGSVETPEETAELPNWCKPKQCDQCKKMFSDVKSLKRHIQAVHSKIKPYVCQVCGHGSAHKHMLRMHMRQHSGEKPYSCHLCTFSTGDHNSLRRHVMRHNGVKPYRCQYCSYAAIQSSSLKKHMASKHPGASGIYSCSQCPFETISAKSFRFHSHDSEKLAEEDVPVQVIYVPPKTGADSETGHLIAINLKSEEDEDDHFLESVIDTGGITIPEDPSFQL